MTSQQNMDPADRETEWARNLWLGYLTGDSSKYEGKARFLRAIFGRLPREPRCKICKAPFRGIGSLLARPFGYSVKAWQMNPTLCNGCEIVVKEHHVGVYVDVAMMFADVRGSSRLAEELGPEGFHRLIDRFYRTSTSILIDADALIEKLIGDEVAGIFVPGIAGPDYTRRAVEAAEALLRASGHGSEEGPWIEIGAGVHTGRVYVGAVGSSESMCVITVLGEAANITARLASTAGVGEVLVSEYARVAAGLDLPGAESRLEEVRGMSESVPVHVLRPGAEPATTPSAP